MTEKEKVREQVAREHPEFTPAHDAAGNYHAVREIVLGGSVTWAGVWKRFTPKPGMKIMDIGANAGVFSAFCAANGAEVAAYEPYHVAFGLLCKLVAMFPSKLTAVHAAIWTHTGFCNYLGNESVLEDSPACNGSVQSSGINWNAGDVERANTVPCLSLDDAIGSQTWDMVKIDTEGSECEILLAASLDTLRRIKFAYIEFHPWVSQELYRETVARLESVYKFEGGYWNSEIGRWEAAYLTL